MQSATEITAAKRSKPRQRELGQFDLFAERTQPIVEQSLAKSAENDEPRTREMMQSDPVQSSIVARDVELAVRNLSCQAAPRPGRQKPIRIHIVSESDLPNYSDDEKAIVDRTLEALPPTKAWFTYADIRQAFTISRATVVRRMKSGVVPGIRFAGDRVMEDGSIRRFTREQVRYLLLAIRRPARQR